AWNWRAWVIPPSCLRLRWPEVGRPHAPRAVHDGDVPAVDPGRCVRAGGDIPLGRRPAPRAAGYGSRAGDADEYEVGEDEGGGEVEGGDEDEYGDESGGGDEYEVGPEAGGGDCP